MCLKNSLTERWKKARADTLYLTPKQTPVRSMAFVDCYGAYDTARRRRSE